MSSVRVWYCPLTQKPPHGGFFVTLPITLPQLQAYASNKGWQDYGSSCVTGDSWYSGVENLKFL
ncbi:MAG TPA: hypothetical protein VE956_00020, partial [Nodularia sp. (in: cyanobacteria)]|nr:hypothetical protein [Nodularia sp. (in: cyanobacteria)]